MRWPALAAYRPIPLGLGTPRWIVLLAAVTGLLPGPDFPRAYGVPRTRSCLPGRRCRPRLVLGLTRPARMGCGLVLRALRAWPPPPSPSASGRGPGRWTPARRAGEDDHRRGTVLVLPRPPTRSTSPARSFSADLPRRFKGTLSGHRRPGADAAPESLTTSRRTADAAIAGRGGAGFPSAANCLPPRPGAVGSSSTRPEGEPASAGTPRC